MQWSISLPNPHTEKDRLPPCQKERVRNCVITANSSVCLAAGMEWRDGGRGGGCPNQGEALFCNRRPIYQSSHREQTLLFQHLFPFLLCHSVVDTFSPCLGPVLSHQKCMRFSRSLWWVVQCWKGFFCQLCVVYFPIDRKGVVGHIWKYYMEFCHMPGIFVLGMDDK